MSICVCIQKSAHLIKPKIWRYIKNKQYKNQLTKTYMYDAKMHALSLMVCVVGDLHTITTTAINEPTRNRIRSTFTHTHTHYTQKHVYMNVFIVYQLQTLHTHTYI